MQWFREAQINLICLCEWTQIHEGIQTGFTSKSITINLLAMSTLVFAILEGQIPCTKEYFMSDIGTEALCLVEGEKVSKMDSARAECKIWKAKVKV